MLKLLHIETPDGTWLVGLDANFKLWRSHPVGWLSYLLSLPGLFHLTRYAYNRWAAHRYEKKYACNRCQS